MLLGSVMHEHVCHDEVRIDDAADTHPTPGNFFNNEGVGEERLPETAILLGNHQAKDPKVLQSIDDIGRVLVLMLQLRRIRQDLLVNKIPNCGNDVALNLCQSFGLRQLLHRNPLLRWGESLSTSHSGGTTLG